MLLLQNLKDYLIYLKMLQSLTKKRKDVLTGKEEGRCKRFASVLPNTSQPMYVTESCGIDICNRKQMKI